MLIPTILVYSISTEIRHAQDLLFNLYFLILIFYSVIIHFKNLLVTALTEPITLE